MFLSFLMLTGCPRDSQEIDFSLGSYTDHLEQNIPRLMERYGIPGVSMALVKGGSIVWSEAFGYADLEKNIPMSADMVCRTESISKSVTAWGVMRLVEKGTVELDAPVTRYFDTWELPVTKYPAEEITVERLLSNSAGLPLGTVGPEIEYAPGDEMPSVRDYLEGEMRFIQPPGEGFVYSNVGYNLMEYVIEHAADRDFARFMGEEILEPLGMESARYGWREDFSGRVPRGYENDGTPVDPYVYPVKGSGGLFATAEDIARFAAASMTGPFSGARPGGGSDDVDGTDNRAAPVLSEESIREIHTPRKEIPGIFSVVADWYGFGHFIETLPDGRRAVWHGGQGHGWMTHVHIVPEAGEGIVILTNSQRTWPFLARVLDEWARWNGLGSVKMGNITTATRIVTALLGLPLVAALWMIANLLWGLLSGTRRLAPFAKTSRLLRLAKVFAGLAVLAVIVWRASLPYIFEASIFPGIIAWGAALLVFFGATLMITALFPRSTSSKEEQQ
jgi:CubicO group peptidase (beta-lactamase class C family)